MTRPQRISAGGIIVADHAILLVRYQSADGSTFLAGPGGALKPGENIVQAIIRETSEETGVLVEPEKVLMIESLACRSQEMCKIWMLCRAVAGEIASTDEAAAEGILEARWFTRAALDGEVVYPRIILTHDWNEFAADAWTVLIPPSRPANF